MKRKIAKWSSFAEANNFVNAATGKQVKLRAGQRMFVNSRYTVSIEPMTSQNPELPRCVMLSIRNNDRTSRHDWRDFQRIKNELVGPEFEAAELYPAESRLVDTSNQFWLFAFEPPFRFPFGFQQRVVSDHGIDGIDIGSVQRPFEHGAIPADLRTFTSDDLVAEVGEAQAKAYLRVGVA